MTALNVIGDLEFLTRAIHQCIIKVLHEEVEIVEIFIHC
jgi:hypothetical protein